jgi:sugar/nucleoside kinase (ribokinase family)
LLWRDCDWEEFLPMVDIFMPNAREALMITKLDNVEDAARKLSGWVSKVVIKDGANGAWISSGNTLLNSPAINFGQVVDTTGAGDCFNAGFLFGHIIKQQPDEVSTRYGNICGGLSVTGIGGAANVPTLDALMQWVAKLEAIGS